MALSRIFMTQAAVLLARTVENSDSHDWLGSERIAKGAVLRISEGQGSEVKRAQSRQGFCSHFHIGARLEESVFGHALDAADLC